MNGSRKRIAALSRKEFLHIVKDPRTLLIVFLLPLIQLVLFGYSFNMEIDEIDLAILDRDDTTASRGNMLKLVQRIARTDRAVAPTSLIELQNGYLVVRHVERVHRQVEGLLNAMQVEKPVGVDTSPALEEAD